MQAPTMLPEPGCGRRASAGAPRGRPTAPRRRCGSTLLLLLTLSVSTGASCQQRLWRTPNALTPPPVVFQQPPALADLIRAVNANSDKVYDLQTDSGQLTAEGLPRSRASLRLERPRSMRLQGYVLANSVLDMGSNDELFWVWLSGEPVLYARHDQFANSYAQQVLPVEPTWLMEAMGLIHLDPAGSHVGPLQRPDGTLEIHTRIPTPRGEALRVLALHPQYGYITEVQLRDAAGGMIASAQCSQHNYDPVAGVVLPQRIAVQILGSQLPIERFVFETDGYVLNRLQAAGPNPQLWMMPGGASQDLGDPRLLAPAARPAAPNTAPGASGAPGPASYPIQNPIQSYPINQRGGYLPPTADARNDSEFRPRIRGFPDPSRGP